MQGVGIGKVQAVIRSFRGSGNSFVIGLVAL
jgi:hypothetical protein